MLWPDVENKLCTETIDDEYKKTGYDAITNYSHHFVAEAIKNGATSHFEAKFNMQKTDNGWMTSEQGSE